MNHNEVVAVCHLQLKNLLTLGSFPSFPTFLGPGFRDFPWAAARVRWDSLYSAGPSNIGGTPKVARRRKPFNSSSTRVAIKLDTNLRLTTKTSSLTLGVGQGYEKRLESLESCCIFKRSQEKRERVQRMITNFRLPTWNCSCKLQNGLYYDALSFPLEIVNERTVCRSIRFLVCHPEPFGIE